MSEMSENKASLNNKSSKINKVKLSVLISLVTLFAVFSGFIFYAGNYSKVYPNTYINQQAVGGMNPNELNVFLGELSKTNSFPETINLTLNGEKCTISPDDIDLAFDLQKTADVALGSETKKGFWSNASAYFGSLFSETDISLLLKYDPQKLDSVISSFASEYETEPKDASYVAENGTLTLKKGNDGQKVDKKALIEEIERNISSKSITIPLVLARAQGKSFDADRLYKELSGPAKDAYYEKDEAGEIIVVSDKPYVKISKQELKEAIKSGKEIVSLSAEITPASKTKADLEEALFSGTMGSWTSYFSTSNVPRTQNVILSASRVNNIVLMPGESFSYDKAVGPRTAENGFKIAGVYINNKVEDGIGGGVCQTSSTLYSAVLYANLEIVSRTSHSLPVSYMPPGQDATIAAGSIDFIFKNNTDYPVKITATIRGGSITCSIIGTPVKGQKVIINNTKTANYEPGIEIETDPLVPKGFKKTVKGSGGYAVSSSRTVYQDGNIIKTEPLTKSVYHATPHIITVNPEDKNVPHETLVEQGAVSENVTPEDIELNGEETETENEKPQISQTEDIIEI